MHYQYLLAVVEKIADNSGRWSIGTMKELQDMR